MAVTSSFVAEPTPYQVLREANWSAGMVKSGIIDLLASPVASKTYPFVVPVGVATRDCWLTLHEAAAVYSMLWIYQLALTSPKVAAFIMEKVGAETAEATTHVHLSLTEKVLAGEAADVGMV
jgi:hypothetical protein